MVRPLNPPSPENMAKLLEELQRGTDPESACMEIGFSYTTWKRWMQFGKEYADKLAEGTDGDRDVKRSDSEEEQEERDRVRYEFWASCSRALKRWGDGPRGLLQRSLQGGKVEIKGVDDAGNPTLKVVHPPGMPAIVAAQFLLEKRVPAYKKKSDMALGGIDPEDGGQPLRVELSTVAQTVRDNLRKLAGDDDPDE